MATIDTKRGQIKDRTAGYKPISYYVDNKSKKVMYECLKAHELIAQRLTPENRAVITSEQMKSLILSYIALDDAGKNELVKMIITSNFGIKSEKPKTTLEQLAEAWLKYKTAQGISEIQLSGLNTQKRIILDFFDSHKLETIDDLKPDTAEEFLAWRRGTRLSNNNSKRQITASTLKHNLQILRQMAKVAARNGWMQNPLIWDDVKIRAIPGVDMKVVEPLPVDTQRKILERLRTMRPELHDAILFLLLTGMRIGELENLKPEWLRNNVITLHGEAIGYLKPSTGKTASAARTLPVCPTVAKIFERKFIFGKNMAKNVRQAIKRYSFAKEFPGIHPHRFRHTFAVNKLLSQTATLQMVSYQLGHSDISLTANLYGKFAPADFKVGFEEVIKERKELVEWLENRYFD